MGSVAIFCAYVWMLLIFSLSSQNGTQTTELSTTCAEKVANVIYQGPTEEQIQHVHSYMRKMAHIVLFSCLGILSYVFFNTVFQIEENGRMVLSFIAAVAVTSCFSFLDEWHKQFIDGRHFQMEEVALNVCSGIVAIAIIMVS